MIDPSSPPAFVTVSATQAVDPLIRAVRDAFQDAMAMRGALCEAAFHVDGFSGKKFKLLMNNLMNELPDPRYLEIGLYHGGTFCSAVYLNDLCAVGMENWSQFEGQRAIFDNNLAAFTSELNDIEIFDGDSHQVDYAKPCGDRAVLCATSAP
jgi:hypothetical protein